MELKLFAYVCMFCDHFAAVFLQQGDLYRMLRCAGRLAMPIFVYCAVKGFCYTSNLNRYLLRLFFLGLVSQVPYMAVFGVRRLNVCFELCGILLFLSMFKLRGFKRGFFPTLGFFLCCCAEYNLRGLALGVSMYAFRNSRGSIRYPVFALASACLNRGLYRVSGLAAFFIRRFERYGSRRKAPRCFYLLYPGHLVLLAVLRHVLA